MSENLVVISNKMARNRLNQEKLKEKLNRYHRSKNCENLVVAKVNREI